VALRAPVRVAWGAGRAALRAPVRGLAGAGESGSAGRRCRSSGRQAASALRAAGEEALRARWCGRGYAGAGARGSAGRGGRRELGSEGAGCERLCWSRSERLCGRRRREGLRSRREAVLRGAGAGLRRRRRERLCGRRAVAPRAQAERLCESRSRWLCGRGASGSAKTAPGAMLAQARVLAAPAQAALRVQARWLGRSSGSAGAGAGGSAGAGASGLRKPWRRWL